MCLLVIPLIKFQLTVAAEQIVRIEASSNYSCVYFSDGKKLLVAKILYWFEERLPTDKFARVHRSHLINTGYISELSEDKRCSLLLYNGERIELSRRKKTGFINLYKQQRLSEEAE